MSADSGWAVPPVAFLSGRNDRLTFTAGHECPTYKLHAHRVRHQEFADTQISVQVQRGGRMARLDAAAHFIPTWTFNLTALAAAFAVNREQATAVIGSSVVDRESAVVRARSEFSIISDKPVSLVLFRCSFDDTPAGVFAQKITTLRRNLCRI